MKILNYNSADFYKDLKIACTPVALSGDIKQAVSSVIADVRNRGDEAIKDFTSKFDGVDISTENLKVSKSEIENALTLVTPEQLKVMHDAINCVQEYHIHTKPKDWRATNPQGATIGENFYPINRVGVYIPGGTAPLVSTVVMTVTLAKLAGCPEICVCTPPSKDGTINPHILCVLNILGVTEIYKVGGAQAVAGMGIGTDSIKAVDKIYGPGNAFVIEAKRQLFGEVGCDLLPGPSEVLIVADEFANPRYIAADLLSQAEHGSGKEKIFFVTTCANIVDKVKAEIEELSKTLSRAEKFKKIIADGCYVAVVSTLDEAAEVANYVAPEHMELQVANPEYLVPKITTAGAILVGEYTPTVLGDFTAGPSHTLPTGRTGRFSSGLQLIDFMRRSSYVKYDKDSIKNAKDVVLGFGKMESLDAHYKSLEQRL